MRYVLCLAIQVYATYRETHGRWESIRRTKHCMEAMLTIWFVFSQHDRTK